MMQSTSMKKEIEKRLNKYRLFYVCRDIERALPLLDIKSQLCKIITNHTKFANKIASRHKNVILIKSERLLDTLQLLASNKVAKLIHKNDLVLVFKNTKLITKICAGKKWRLLNPPAELSAKAEEKVSQVRWLGDLEKYLPPHRVELCKNIIWPGEKFILQFNHSHTGSGTLLIETKKQLEDIKTKFPHREARAVEYIEGPIFTNNNIVWGNMVLTGNISYQITGLSPFTENPFATIGNDWRAPHKILTKKQRLEYERIAREIGQKFAGQGWRGLFGIDAVLDEKTGRIYLIEINARQPASTSFESELQTACRKSANEITVFQAHLSALLGLEPGKQHLIKINNGAQIVQRVTEKIDKMRTPKIDSPDITNIILYTNDKPGSDLCRIQTGRNLASGHNILSKQGRAVLVSMFTAYKSAIWNSGRAGIIFRRNNGILLMKRHKYGDDYFAMPGGTLEEGEDFLSAAIREAIEETGLKFDIDTNIKPVKLLIHRHEMYFFAKNIIGEPVLGGPESARNSPNNHYELVWVPVKKLKNTDLRPKELKKRIVNFFAQ
jgi:8-oxo-dGTP diphosphatase